MKRPDSEMETLFTYPKKRHSITNDGNEMVEFLAFGGLTGITKG